MSNSKPGKLIGIEASRGVAAAAVVIYHVSRHLDKNHGMPLPREMFQFGHAGVDLFFVLSGFIILHVHYRDIGKPFRLGHYLGRRFTRVYPIYWVALAITMAMGLGHGVPSFADFAWSVTLAPSNSDLILDIAWTLRHEILFYALFCVLIVNRRAGTAMFGLWLAGIVAAALGPEPPAWLPKTLYSGYNLEFYFGMAIAWAVRTGAIARPRRILLLGVALFASVGLAEDFGLIDGLAIISRVLYGVPAALIVLGLAASGREAPLHVPRPLRVLGAASYSIYLFQFVFIGLIWKFWLFSGLDQVTPPAASFPLLVIGGVGGGILASRWIEYPLMQMSRGDRRRILAPVAAR